MTFPFRRQKQPRPKSLHLTSTPEDRPVMLSDLTSPIRFAKDNWWLISLVLATLLYVAAVAVGRAMSSITARLDGHDSKLQVMDAKLDVMLIDRGHDPRTVVVAHP